MTLLCGDLTLQTSSLNNTLTHFFSCLFREMMSVALFAKCENYKTTTRDVFFGSLLEDQCVQILGGQKKRDYIIVCWCIFDCTAFEQPFYVCGMFCCVILHGLRESIKSRRLFSLPLALEHRHMISLFLWWW